VREEEDESGVERRWKLGGDFRSGSIVRAHSILKEKENKTKRKY
jgi:hypothetical protein